MQSRQTQRSPLRTNGASHGSSPPRQAMTPLAATPSPAVARNRGVGVIQSDYLSGGAASPDLIRESTSGPRQLASPFKTMKVATTRGGALSPAPMSISRLAAQRTLTPTAQTPPPFIAEATESDKATEPKIMVPFLPEPGKPPRKIEIERRKRMYAQQNIEELLLEQGLDFSTRDGVRLWKSYLPLDAFDNSDFDSRTSDDWIELTLGGQRPVPGKAISFTAEGAGRWRSCGMTAINPDNGRYKIRWDDSGDEEWVPRVGLLFVAEDPFSFAIRVATAIKKRREAESMLKYNLYIDSMPTDGIPALLGDHVDHIKAQVKVQAPAGSTQALWTEIEKDYARAMNRLIFDDHLADPAQHELLESLDLPESEWKDIPERGTIAIPEYEFPERFHEFTFSTCYSKVEAIRALTRVRTECNKFGKTPLFNVAVTKSSKLEEFEQMQQQFSLQVARNLRDQWTKAVEEAIRSSLKDAGKGWFNLQESSREVYEGSKLKRLLRVVTFMMQDTLRYLTEASLQQYAGFFEDAASSIVTVRNTDNVETEHPQAQSLRSPLFNLELSIRDNQLVLSTDTQRFKDAPIALLEKALQAVQTINQLETTIMEGLFKVHNTPVLAAVDLQEPVVAAAKTRLRTAMSTAVEPLLAYLATYDQYKQLISMNIDEWFETFKAREFNVAEIREEFEKHARSLEEIRTTIPTTITVGVFNVNCVQLRNALAEKRQKITKLIPDYVTKHVKNFVEEVTKKFGDIHAKLRKRPNNIEELAKLREYIATVPKLVNQLTAKFTDVSDQYNALEDMEFALSNEDFKLQWTTFGWPQKIDRAVAELNQQLERDRERFEDDLVGAQEQFEHDLQAVSAIVLEFHQYSDMEDIAEIVKKAKKTQKDLKDLDTKAKLFNQRELLFERQVTEYSQLSEITRKFEPFLNLWINTNDWVTWQSQWMSGPLLNLNPEQMDKDIKNAWKVMFKLVKQFKMNDQDGCLRIAENIKKQMDEFMPHVPLIQRMCNPGMRDRHWDEISKQLGFDLHPDESFTLSKMLTIELTADQIEVIGKVSEVAGKEYSIEQALEKMEGEWKETMFEILAYKETGTFVVKGTDEIVQQLDDHIVMTQSMSFSPFKKAFADRIDKWESKLNLVSEIIEQWLSCQRSWLYLEPIFSSDDINRQLPVEGKRFTTVDRLWRKTMAAAKQKPHVLAFCSSDQLLKDFRECNKLLDQVQKGLNQYLETKRAAFARFYFLSNDELLEILSQTKDPTAVQPHLRKCFEAIQTLDFQSDQQMTAMNSAEGEKVPFVTGLYPKGNVENWLGEVEAMMKVSIRQTLENSIKDYLARPRSEWVTQWQGQIVLAASQKYWTQEVEQAMRDKGAAGVKQYYGVMLKQLDDLTKLVRGNLSRLARITLGALITIDVHARDVTNRLVENQVSSITDFEWISQMRYYWENDNCVVKQVQTAFGYGYEYLGNTSRLVITPLTDRIYMTLMGALHLHLGGAPAGPAGTGKTETTKDLAKALAKQCVVFNCSDGLDYLAMGKFFKGLASAGAWACFDEFNRIDIEVLSVIAQQITQIQRAIIAQSKRFVFEGTEISLDPACCVFITMNPGYAGRTELPDNLKVLFRPVACMVPDYALIAEIRLYSFGFSKASALAQKMVATFKLSSEQLSSQDHYDFGMRAVNTVISNAGNLKRQFPDMNEDQLLLRALRDSNLPKFLPEDIILFSGIVSDLFPGTAPPEVDYGNLMQSLTDTCHARHLQPTEYFLLKCIQLFETTVVRHGLMLVGPTGGGKTSTLKVLAEAMTRLRGVEEFQKTDYYILNPKSITMGQLYGNFDENTHEWSDGIAATLVRVCAQDTTEDKKWIVFDGPVDAIWIENMNTVLDDNKKLCLVSGEIIKMTPAMTMMFEVEDLSVASPATVSRCGMVFVDPEGLTVEPVVQSWLELLPKPHITPLAEPLKALFDVYLRPCFEFLRYNLKELVPTFNGGLLRSLCNIMDCFFSPFVEREGMDPVQPAQVQLLTKNLEALFLFSLIWSVGATCDSDGRKKFDVFLRDLVMSTGTKLLLPSKGSLYDYVWDQNTSTWVDWMSTIPAFKLDPRKNFSDIIVPTPDSVCYTYLLDLFINNQKQVLCVGQTGTGKTVTIVEKLMKGMAENYDPLFISFSAQTSANQTQDLLDSKFDKRRKGVYGAPAGKRFVVFVDDLNMPAREKYGAQPPIELLRQWMDHKGWYDRKDKELPFMHIIDIQFVAAMGPPGGGRNPVTNRFIRHFNMIAFADLSDSSMTGIFNTILNGYLSAQGADILRVLQPMTEATIDIYGTITRELRPTPSKSHYTFNLRDVSKVFQGILAADMKLVKSAPDMIRLWLHECTRVFRDRLVDQQDRDWFKKLLSEKLQSYLKTEWASVVTQERLLYGDFMQVGADVRSYAEIADMRKVVKTVEDYLEDYNAVSNAPMKLVMFLDAIEHVCRISRVIRQPQGHALLLGVGGSGRQSLTRLATHMAEYSLFQVEIAKNYGNIEWREDLKKVLTKAGLENQTMVFLFTDTQIVRESFLEDVNNILNTGEVPALWAPDEMDNILSTCRPLAQAEGGKLDKNSVYAYFVTRCKRNIHMVLAMSPIGDVFRSRLRQFPSLVNCCTIDWFAEWPEEALVSVARESLSTVQFKDEEVLKSVVDMCMFIHQSVAGISHRYLSELRRYNYVTPTSYLELLSSYKKLLDTKRDENGTKRKRLENGLTALLSTAAQVEDMQAQLRELQPQLVIKSAQVEEMIVTIQSDTVEADKVRKEASEVAAQADQMAAECKTIADDAQRDLDKALPALEAATDALKQLNRNDVIEVRTMTRPPDGVKLVMEAVCVMFKIKPKMVDGPKVGTKVPDYWEPARGVLADPNAFLKSLLTYDKDKIAESVIVQINKYIDLPDFQPERVAQVSKACKSICLWVRAMHKYYYVAKEVEPKRMALAAAQAEKQKADDQLAAAAAKLRGVEAKIADLQAKYDAGNAEKLHLEKQAEECKARLARAEKLVGGLGGERVRWSETVQELGHSYEALVGDIMVSAGIVSYGGAFTSSYRQDLAKEWQKRMSELKVPHTAGANLIGIMGDPVQIRTWNIAGLPSDSHSTENGIIVSKSRRWPLLIDPQGQANKWIKNTEKERGLETIKLSNKDFLRTLENAIRFGKPVLLENIEEDLDAALEPVLLQSTFFHQGTKMIRLGDSTIPYHNDFKFYMTTKLPNPHYKPEVSVKVTLINFTITQSGLQDQLLGIVVEKERPDLERQKAQLVISNAQMRKELQQLEDTILFKLSNVEGNILDDQALIDTLAASKLKSNEISAKVQEAEVTEREIDEARQHYIPVAVRAAILFFCVADLANVDPMYQNSLAWFINLFTAGIADSEKSDDLQTRMNILNDFITYSTYNNVCRSLFEKHKLLFSLLLTTRIMQGAGQLDAEEWRFLIAGGASAELELANPADWLIEKGWIEILNLNKLPAFKGFAPDFAQNVGEFKKYFDSEVPWKLPLLEPWQTKLSEFQRLLVLRCLRADKMELAVQDFVAHRMGQRFIEPPTFNLEESFRASNAITPMIFVLSAGADPAADLNKFAEQMRMSSKLSSISLGQGQGPLAKQMIMNGIEKGTWVLLQNCHLAPSWMPALERIIEEFDMEKMDRNFRLWLTSMPSDKFPVAVLQSSVKMTNEPPKGLRMNLRGSFSRFDDNFLNNSRNPATWKKLLYGLCFFHAVIQERRKFGPLGWNIAYEYTSGDLEVCQTQLKLFLEEYEEVPYKVLRFLCGQINYGGRVTDDWDRRTLMTIIDEFLCPEVLTDEYTFSPSGIYKSVPAGGLKDYGESIKLLPLNPKPEIFGLHENADITCAQNDTWALFDTLLLLQPRVASGGGKSRDQILQETASDILMRTPKPFVVHEVQKKYPVKYEESMNTVLVQECIRYNGLLETMHRSLSDLLKAIKGLVVMSGALDMMGTSIFNNQIPVMWAGKAYPSMKPLGLWTNDLIERVKFINNWIQTGIPRVYWFSGFYFPQAFLTGTLQNFARRQKVSIDRVSFEFDLLDSTEDAITSHPDRGCYIRGLYLEGARWDPIRHALAESRPKELFTEMPVIHVKPVIDRIKPKTGIYDCPCYKILTRAGTLSTTGHSTNYVITMELPSQQAQRHWIKAGVALFCALNY